jgi:dTDP-4-amino-4,6-dideoxygalactose transaminase
MVGEKIGPGDLNAQLVQYVREVFGVDGAVALRSPSIALKYIFRALDLSSGDGVLLSALAPMWQFQTVEELGFRPVVIDVAAETGQVTVETVAGGMKDGAKVLILHETLGFLPDISGILELGIPVVEDISQSAGASLGEKRAGTFGVFSILGLEEQDMLTAGGGAVLMAPGRREWIVLKKLAAEGPVTDILPDINAALGYVQLKERPRNDGVRREMHTLYTGSLMQRGGFLSLSETDTVAETDTGTGAETAAPVPGGASARSGHRTIIQSGDAVIPAVYSFPVILSSGYKEIKQYAARKEIDIIPAFEKTIAASLGDDLEGCINAKSLLLRCVLFPLYPRLGSSRAAKVAKVLATLP